MSKERDKLAEELADPEEAVKLVLNELVKEHAKGGEAFVSPGYNYHEDALIIFSGLIKERDAIWQSKLDESEWVAEWNKSAAEVLQSKLAEKAKPLVEAAKIVLEALIASGNGRNFGAPMLKKAIAKATYEGKEKHE